MRLELGGAVGSDLLVYGTLGLSVGDASIMPLIPGTHLYATAYAIAEKVCNCNVVCSELQVPCKPRT